LNREPGRDSLNTLTLRSCAVSDDESTRRIHILASLPGNAKSGWKVAVDGEIGDQPAR